MAPAAGWERMLPDVLREKIDEGKKTVKTSVERAQSMTVWLLDLSIK